MMSNGRAPLRTGLLSGLLLLGFGACAAAQAAEESRCHYTTRMICTSEGCQPTTYEGMYVRAPALPALRQAVTEVAPIRLDRCDEQGCDDVEITNTGEGGFLTLSAMEGSYLIKIYDGPEIPEIELKTGDFIEVITSMLTTFIGYGQCVPAAD